MYEDLAKQLLKDCMGRSIEEGIAIICGAINKAVTETREQLLTDFKAAREADAALIAKLQKEIQDGKE